MFRRTSAPDVPRDADGNVLVDTRGDAALDTNGHAATDTDRVGYVDSQPAQETNPLTTQQRTYRSAAADVDGDGIPDASDRDVPAVAPVETAPDTVPVPERVGQRWAHVSAAGTLSLIIGTAAAIAVLSGALAPLGVVAGGVAVLLSLMGFAMVRRNGVTGHSIAMLGLLLGAASIIIGLLAINGNLSWLAQDTNGVTRLNDWLTAHISWLTNW
jgi:hypothetical protein